MFANPNQSMTFMTCIYDLHDIYVCKPIQISKHDRSFQNQVWCFVKNLTEATCNRFLGSPANARLDIDLACSEQQPVPWTSKDHDNHAKSSHVSQVMPNHANHAVKSCQIMPICYFSMHLLKLNMEPTAQGEVGAMLEAEEASEAYSNPPEVELAEASDANHQNQKAVQVAQVAHATPAQVAQAVVKSSPPLVLL